MSEPTQKHKQLAERVRNLVYNKTDLIHGPNSDSRNLTNDIAQLLADADAEKQQELVELRNDKEILDRVLDIDSPYRIVVVDSEGEYLNEPPLWNRELLHAALQKAT